MRPLIGSPNWPVRLLLSLLLSGTGCSDIPVLTHITESPTPEPTGTLQAFVTSLDGEPLADVSFSLEGRVLAISASEGAVELTGLPLGKALQLTVSRPGFSSSSREVVLQTQQPSTLRFRLQPSRDAVLDRAELGGKLFTPDGLELVFPPNAVVDAHGNSVIGPLQVRYTLLDEPAELPLAPGDFHAQQRDGSTTLLESFGMAEVKLEHNGQPVQLAAPVTLRFPLFQSYTSADSTLYAGQSIGLYSFDDTTGRWLEEGVGAVIYLNGKATFEATVSHFSWWNADMPLDEKNCITGKAVDESGYPIPNLTVEAIGEDYAGGSTSITQQDGLFCVDVKRGSLNTLSLYGGTPAKLYELQRSNVQVQPVATECSLGDCLELGILIVPVTSDRDHDGVSVLSGDCDDDSPRVNPSSAETCNGRDDDCDGALDENFDTRQSYYADLDGDTFGNLQESILACAQPSGYTSDAQDCDDTRASVHPNAAESCNGRDDNCDGDIDEGVLQQLWPDADLDGDGDATAASVYACGIPLGYSQNLNDCDDSNPNIHLNTLELCDGLDNNCNFEIDEQATVLLFPDLDADGYGDQFSPPLQGCVETAQTSLNHLDCDDAAPQTSPEADELDDGVDNNCNGEVDETETVLYPDLDGDGYGSNTGEVRPVNSPGYSVLSGDCDDVNADFSPGASEICDGLDNDCDGQVDEQLPLISLYQDSDGDGFGDSTQVLSGCGASAGYVFNPGDCDDQTASIHPNAEDGCNGLDDDCDGAVDEGIPLDRYYSDEDGDGYGAASSPVDACAAPSGTVSNHNDCNDGNAELHPGVPEQCNGLDDDCDGMADEDFVALYYTDADGDGYGDETPDASCQKTELSVVRGGDCDDTDASAYPGAPDAVGDGIDLSCDGSDGLAPSVGLPTSSFTTLQAAMDAAGEGQTVWVGPGTYSEVELTMKGKALRLVSTEGETTTIIDAQGQGTLFSFVNKETEASVVQGFTLTGGYSSAGGGMYLFYSSPTVTHVIFTGNTALGDEDGYGGYGGGMYLSYSSPTLTHVTFTGNEAAIGGGMSLAASSPTLTHVTFTGNTAYYGGGMSLIGSSPTLTHVTFTVNEATMGGGMYLYDYSSPTLTDVTFTGNEAKGEDFGYGGGMYLGYSFPMLTHVSFRGNEATMGGGMDLDHSSPTLTHVTFTDNTAEVHGYGYYDYGYGGGMNLWYSSPTLTHVSFTGNEAGYGGGMYLSYSAPTLTHSILAYNQSSESGGNLSQNTSENTSITAQYSLIYNPSGWKADTITPSGTYLTVEPKFLDYADSLTGAFCTPGASTTCVPADLHPALGSPLIDAGDPAQQDVDGSRADLGSSGGSGGDQWDVDGDGTPDYFWPGERSDAPSGFNPVDYDLNDLDANVQ